MNNERKIPGFHSIRNRILIFSILVTLVPSCGMGWFWFDMTHKATTEKTEQKLVDSASIAEREISLWFKERNYDLRVFANSFIILDNLRKYNAESDKQKIHLRNIAKYLALIKEQFPTYRRLAVVDRAGKILLTSDSAAEDRPLALSGDWRGQVDTSGYFVGDVSFVGKDGVPIIPVGVTLFNGAKELHLGYLVMEVELYGLLPVLRASLPRTDRTGAGNIGLFTTSGKPIMTAFSQGVQVGSAIAPAQLQKLLQTPRRLQEFVNGEDIRLVGIVSRFVDLPWNLTIAENADEVFDGLIRARNRIVLITLLLTIAIGGTATIVASQIIIPLQKLTVGVLRVAGGDLDVAVTVRKEDELGLVSGMFNEMVRRLKENQAKLEQLATTDPLTGLANRKQIMTDLSVHFEQFRRYETDFSLLMIDIDFFKQINDTHGHQAGDAVLIQLAQIFRETLRSLDNAGRYGGEEFLICLGQIDIKQAQQTAERIRRAVDQHTFVCGDISIQSTVSIGVAGIGAKDGSIAELIGRADKAMYVAKTGGRNRVALG